MSTLAAGSYPARGIRKTITQLLVIRGLWCFSDCLIHSLSLVFLGFRDSFLSDGFSPDT